jgi:hypothetical protein
MNMALGLEAFTAFGEIMVSNSYYNALDPHLQAEFEVVKPVDARNI